MTDDRHLNESMGSSADRKEMDCDGPSSATHVDSILKSTYLLIFMLSAGDIWMSTIAQKATIIELFFSPFEDGTGKLVYSIVLMILLSFIVVHMVRIYLVIEALEDPNSADQNKFLSVIGKSQKYSVIERRIRAVLIIIISLKIVLPDGSPASLAGYFLVLYTWLLFWDFFVFYYGGVKLKSTYIKSSTVFLMSLILVIIFVSFDMVDSAKMAFGVLGLASGIVFAFEDDDKPRARIKQLRRNLATIWRPRIL